MYSRILLLVALATTSLVNAAVIQRVVQDDEVLAYGHGGRLEVIKLADWKARVAAEGSMVGRPSSPLDNPEAYPNISNQTLSNEDHNAGALSKRCPGKYIVRRDDQTFYDWDIPMSQIVVANGDPNNIAATYSMAVANTISVTRSVDLTLVKDYVSTTISTTWEQSWTTTTSIQYILGVPKGFKFGIMVFNPRVFRRSGWIRDGCIGKSQSVGYFQLDEHKNHDWSGVKFVEGLVSICASNTLPIPNCIGKGSHS